jgi:gliding motility-associated-like protein
MKKLWLLVVALIVTCGVFAQTPVNDDCAGLIDLGAAPVCPPDIFNNVNATPSNIGNDNAPSCFNSGTAERDVWFMFTCPDTLFDFRITVTGVGGNGIQNPEFAVYRGDCIFDGLAELLCAKADLGENSVFLDVTGLTPGIMYFIRVSDYSATATPNSGDFTLCVGPIPPVNNIDDGGSTLCEGTLFDTGGPDGDYSSNEDNTFVICPNQPNGCITFTLNYYNIEPGFGASSDALTFYDGPNTSAPVLAQIQGGGFGDIAPAAGGGVCFQVQATSGCLTVQFTSDGVVEQEGFMGQWECSTQPCVPPSSLTVNTTITNTQIIDAVSTAATTVTVADINCANNAYGTFEFATDNNELGLKKGLVLTSGDANLVVGPNFFTNAGLGNGGGSDPDLEYLSIQQGNGLPTNDACVVELDVFVATNELTFEYVFGSDEYPEYAYSNFNDIFAFLVSGPGIVGDPGLINSAKNIAVLPGTNLPIQINNVNNLLNWQYYRNTEISQTLEYDGLTSDSLGVKKSLTARTAVIPCNTYRLKLAVADRGDSAFDSGVFVSDIQGGTPDLAVQFASGIDYFIEDCSGADDFLVISLSSPVEETTSFVVNIGGTATLGVDYLLNIPNVITFLPGQTTLTFPITPLDDNLVEGNETITISLSNNFGCGTVVYKTITIDLKDNVEVLVNGGDTLFVCAGATLQLEATGAANYFWAPPGAVSNPFIGTPTITPTNDIWLEVTGTIATCVDKDSVFIKIIAPTLDAEALTPVNICQGNSVTLIANNNVNNMGLTWTPAAGLNSTTAGTVIATPSVTTTYKVTLAIAGCTLTDEVVVNVDTLFFPDFFVTDTTICENYSVNLAEVLTSSTSYSWTPNAGLDDPTSSGPLATPNTSTIYTLTATSANNYCSSTASVTVNVIAADVDITGPGYVELCLGDTLFLSAQSAPNTSVVQWSPAFYVNTPTGPNVFTVPDESYTLTATYNVNGCIVYDSVQIRVDSLPFSAITRVPDKSIYCPGDTIYLISKTYEPASFPDMEHEWALFGGQLTPVENWNMVIVATATNTFERLTTNRGCSRLDTVPVPVATPPQLFISYNPPAVCPGEQVQLNLIVDPPGTVIEWTSDQTLSCTDCLNPTVTPTGTASYTVKATEADCPSEVSVTIPVLPLPTLGLPVNPVICPGQQQLLNQALPQPGVLYAWTSEPPGFVSSQANPVVSPDQTTTYTVTAEGPGFCQTTEIVTVTVAQVAELQATSSTFVCLGQTAEIVLTVTPPGTAIQWQSAQQLSCQNCLNPTVVPTGTDTYTVTTPQATCPDTLTFTIPVLPLPILSLAQNPSICLGTAVILNTAPPEPNITYTWTSTPSGFVSGVANPAVSPTQTTTYTIVANGPGVCEVQQSVTVTPLTAEISAGADQEICPGENATLTATVTGTQGTIVWQPGSISGAAIQVSPSANLLYTATLSYGPNNSCVDSDQVLVEVSPPVQITELKRDTTDDEVLCLGEPLTLKAIVTPAGDNTFVWTQNGTILAGLTADSVRIVLTGDAGVSVVGVTATNSFGCTATETIEVETKRCFDMPNAFTPGNDDVNNVFRPIFFGGSATVVSFQVYNRWGNKVFEAKDNLISWDGKHDGKDAPMDVYVYYIKIRYANGEEEERRGDVTLMR